MRNFGIWISPRMHPNDIAIVDTANMQADDYEFFMLDRGSAALPLDTVLVLVHPNKYIELKESLRLNIHPFLQNRVDIGKAVAKGIIEQHCSLNPELRLLLHWS